MPNLSQAQTAAAKTDKFKKHEQFQVDQFRADITAAPFHRMMFSDMEQVIQRYLRYHQSQAFLVTSPYRCIKEFC